MACSGNHWTQTNDKHLKKLFLIMDINEIADIFKRTPHAIKCRLIKLNLTDDGNFIKKELLELEKIEINNNNIPRRNGIEMLSEIISKHFLKLEAKINELNKRSLNDIDE